MSAPISGRCDERFAGVRRAFAQNFASRGEVGAGVCILVDGEPVVDLVGGWRDGERRQQWGPDTLVNFYSVGKAVLGLLALQLVDDGVVGLDDPIASVWPGFAAASKGGATLRHALCHRASVPAIRARLTDEDLWSWQTMTDALAGTEPFWEPGTRHAYHTNTYGHLVGEVVRRVTAQSPGTRLRTVAAGIGADLWFGVPASEQGRCAEVLWAPGDTVRGVPAGLSGDDLMVALGYFNPPGYSSVGVVNTSRWRSAEVPSTNGHGTAVAVARFYGALLEEGRLLSPVLLAEATGVQSQGYCPVLGEEVAFGLGFTPTTARRPFGPHPASFGHYGTGGAVGFADPGAKVAFGYVMNHVVPRWRSTRNQALIEALYRAL